MAVTPAEPGPVGPRRLAPRPRPLDVAPVQRPAQNTGGEVLDAAVAVLAVAAVIVRYAAELAAADVRWVLPRLPVVGRGRPVLRRAWYTPAGRVVAHPLSAAVRAMSALADEVVPGVARAVLARLDLPALLHDYVDLDRIAAQLDVAAVVARVDLDSVAAGLDLDTLVDKVDIARILDRIDLDAVVARVDLDRAVAGVDIERVLDRVDLDAVVDRVDLDRAVSRVDIDRVIAQTDVAGLAKYVIDEVDLPALLRSSTGSVSAEMVRGLRYQTADADRAMERVVDRLLRRNGRRAVPGEGPKVPEPRDDQG